MIESKDHLSDPIVDYIRTDFPVFEENLSVAEVLETIRERGLGDRIFYFYVVDSANKLVGVIPTRRLLVSPLETRLQDIMIKRVASLPEDAVVSDACEFFIMHKFLAVPVINSKREIMGIADVGLFTGEMLEFSEKREVDDVFQWIGLHVWQIKESSPFLSFRYRFPWLAATMASGIACAVIVSFFETTLEKAVVLASFLTLMLGLGESISVQSLTAALQRIHSGETGSAFFRNFRNEFLSALMLGLACGIVVAGIAQVWRGQFAVSAIVAVTILLSATTASIIGSGTPYLLHALRRDPKIATGPIALALADIMTIIYYLGAATIAYGS